jgi:hypothetical protein
MYYLFLNSILLHYPKESQDPVIKITDFGLAVESLRSSKEIAGTLLYMV